MSPSPVAPRSAIAGFARSMNALGLQEKEPVPSTATKRTTAACEASAMFAATVCAVPGTADWTGATWSQALVSSPAHAAPQTR